MSKEKLSTFYTEPIEEKKKNIILLLDFHNLVYRTLYVSYNEFKNRRNSFLLGDIENEWSEKDMYSYWKHLVMSSFLYTIEQKKPNKIIIAMEGRGNWRKSIYPDYKGNRKKGRDESEINFEEFYEILDKFINDLKELFKNIYIMRINNCEADDVIAVMTEEFSKDKLNDIELISTDKDFIQLQKYKNFKQFNPIKKEYVKSINPKRDLEIKIIIGDKSDNISGIKERLGAKTAEKLLNGGEFKKQTWEQMLNDKEIKNIFIRNRQLIDFNYIPENIKEKIVDEYNNYKIGKLDGNKVWKWMISQRMSKLSDDWQLFLKTVSNLE